MAAASEVLLRRPQASKSSTELIRSLRSYLRSSPPSPPPSPPSTSSSLQSSAAATLQSTPLYLPLPPIADQLREGRAEYDVTVKLFHLAAAPRSSHGAHTRDAIKRVLATLGISTIDLVVLSLPGISFDAEDDGDSDDGDKRLPDDAGADSDNSDNSDKPDANADGGSLDAEVSLWLKTYAALEELHDSGVVAKLGISEFGTGRLARLLAHARVRPAVDQINVRDCCVVPRPLILLAREQGVELLTHNDYPDVLPADVLRRMLVDEFGVALPRPGAQVLPQWVAKYTVVVRSRGVVENKGYSPAPLLS